MAKKMVKKMVATEEKVKNLYPSTYGTHSSMVDEEETAKLTDSNKVAAKDDHGIYITDRNRLDTGLADPNRYSNRKVKSE